MNKIPARSQVNVIHEVLSSSRLIVSAHKFYIVPGEGECTARQSEMQFTYVKFMSSSYLIKALISGMASSITQISNA